ncbi:MAG TPA: hypothetical protein PKC19_22370, partial [Roseiflexaceae bacterium]|nr:hypothetical protein [Roseiflexaceae bacterium]
MTLYDQFHHFANLLPEPIILVCIDGKLRAANRAAQQQFHLPANPTHQQLNDLVDESAERITTFLHQSARTRSMTPGALRLRTADQSHTSRSFVEGGLWYPATYDSPALVIIRWRSRDEPLKTFADLNEKLTSLSRQMFLRERANEQQRRMDERLRHVQKLESLAVLAGGVAHDFNNLLTSILGYAELALLDLHPTSAPYESVMQIRLSALRAAELARQMLTF